MIVPGPNIFLFRVIRGVLYLWVVVLVLALWPYTEDPAAPIKEFASAIALLAMAILWASSICWARAPYRVMDPPLWFLPVFFGVLVITALVSGAAARGMEAIRPWFVFACIGFIAFQTCPHVTHLRTLFRVIVASIALSSVYGFMQHCGLDPFPWAQRDVEEYRALPATYGNPNLAGHVLVIGLILCSGLAADAWRRGRRSLEFTVLLGIGVLLSAHLRLTHMRSGLVALAVAALFTAVFLIAMRRSGRPVVACVIALGNCALLAGAGGVTALIMANALGLDSSLQLRLHGYAGAAAMFLDHAFLGVGPGNYAFENIPYWSTFESLWYALEGKRNFHVHNEWIESAVESGIVGIATLIGLFLFAILTFFQNPYFVVDRHRTLLLALPAALVAVATDACFGFNLHAPVSAGLFFLLLPLRPAIPFYSEPTRPTLYRNTILLCLASLTAAWGSWRDYRHELDYQHARGAVLWEQAPQHAAQIEHATPAGETTLGLLRQLEESRPWDYRAPVLLGDFAMMQRQFTEASQAYKRAVTLHPYLPRLHVQVARATLRAAQAEAIEMGPALGDAKMHVTYAQTQCPELAEAWTMMGWVLYLQGQDPDAVIASFEHARRCGEVADGNRDAVLGALYRARQSWGDSATTLARSTLLSPEIAARWTDWEEAARKAGREAMAFYGQSLLHELGRYPSDVMAGQNARVLAPAPLAMRVLDFAESRAQRIVASRALARTLDGEPRHLAFWSAWLGTQPAALRAEALVERIHVMNVGGIGPLPPLVLDLGGALEFPEIADLAALARIVSRTLATPPSGNDGALGRVHAPLAALLEAAMKERGPADASLGTARCDLGAVYLETGNPERAEEILRAAELSLPAAEVAHCSYYRSRALAALGQPEAALALAKAAMDADGGIVEYRWNMALRLVDAGRADAARFLYESLRSSLAPDHPYQAQLARELAQLPPRSTEP